MLCDLVVCSKKDRIEVIMVGVVVLPDLVPGVGFKVSGLGLFSVLGFGIKISTFGFEGFGFST